MNSRLALIGDIPHDLESSYHRRRRLTSHQISSPLENGFYVWVGWHTKQLAGAQLTLYLRLRFSMRCLRLGR